MKLWENRRSFIMHSKTLILLFLVVYFLTSIVMGAILANLTPAKSMIWVVICNVFMLIMVWTKRVEMSGGVDYVMQKMDAVEINQFNYNPIMARYIQVATEMTIASSVGHVRLFVIPAYDINAFAIATTTKDTAIAITEGALTRLTRSELQALVGHEISHILHRDPIINFKLIAWLFGLQSIYLYGEMMFMWITRGIFGDLDFLNRFCLGHSLRTVGKGSDGFDSDWILVHIVVMIVLSPVIMISAIIMLSGAVGAIVARLIKAYISRTREYLADAESVRFVRGQQIINVLEKIAFLEGDEEQYNTTNYDADHQEFSHFYLQNYQPKKSFFDTHPPILERIKKIRPNYRSLSPKEIQKLDNRFTDKRESEDLVLVSALTQYATNRRMNMTHDMVSALNLNQIGSTVMIKLAKCYACFIETDNTDMRKKQFDYLNQHASTQLFRLIHSEAEHNKNIPVSKRLDILSKEIPNFTDFAQFQRDEIETICQHLVDIDEEVTIPEYCMMLIIRAQIYQAELNGALSFTSLNESILDHEELAANFLAVTTAAMFFPRLRGAENCYNDVASYLNIKIPFKHISEWREILDDIFPQLKNLSNDARKDLQTVFIELNKIQSVSQNGKCLLFVVLRALDKLY